MACPNGCTLSTKSFVISSLQNNIGTLKDSVLNKVDDVLGFEKFLKQPLEENMEIALTDKEASFVTSPTKIKEVLSKVEAFLVKEMPPRFCKEKWTLLKSNKACPNCLKYHFNKGMLTNDTVSVNFDYLDRSKCVVSLSVHRSLESEIANPLSQEFIASIEKLEQELNDFYNKQETSTPITFEKVVMGNVSKAIDILRVHFPEMTWGVLKTKKSDTVVEYEFISKDKFPFKLLIVVDTEDCTAELELKHKLDVKLPENLLKDLADFAASAKEEFESAAKAVRENDFHLKNTKFMDKVIEEITAFMTRKRDDYIRYLFKGIRQAIDWREVKGLKCEKQCVTKNSVIYHIHEDSPVSMFDVQVTFEFTNDGRVVVGMTNMFFENTKSDLNILNDVVGSIGKELGLKIHPPLFR